MCSAKLVKNIKSPHIYYAILVSRKAQSLRLTITLLNRSISSMNLKLVYIVNIGSRLEILWTCGTSRRWNNSRMIGENKIIYSGLGNQRANKLNK